jgi:hypothetical protein
MKANLKGSGGIKGLALRHGEKLVIAVVGLLALWFMYSALKLPSLEDRLQADVLKGQISQTRAAMEGSTWPEADDAEGRPDVREFKPIAKTAITKIDDGHYKIRPIQPSIVSTSRLRGDPVVLNALDVRAYSESGLLAFRDENTLAEQQRRQQLKLEEEQREQKRKDADMAKAGEAEAIGRRGGPEVEVGTEAFDPNHPQRRLLEVMGSQATGVPLAGGERLERVSWVTIVAKVPIREQLKLFQDAFQNARGYDPAQDFPQYAGYRVQRREIVDGKPTDWKVVNVYDGQKKKAGSDVNGPTIDKLNAFAASEWAGPTLEPVDARWTDMLLTLPLPPLVGRNFGQNATHPDIPLAINAPPPEVEQVPVDSPAAKPAEGEDDGDFSAGVAGQPRSVVGEYAQPRMPMGRGYGGPESGMGLGFRPGMGMGGPEGEFRMEGRFGPGGGPTAFGGISGGRTSLPREVDDLLLRFFDFTVEPGKEYQYRVMVYIADPNNRIPLKSGMLESAVIDRRLAEIQKARAAKKNPPWARAAKDWSEPSPIVGVSSGGTVHVAEAKVPAADKANDEPSIKMIAETFDIEPTDNSAIHVAKETEVRRGAVINLTGKMRYSGGSGGQIWIDTMDEYSLNTGLTVLDIEGGDDLGKKMAAPSRVLLMDEAGQLVVREELDDSTSVRQLRQVFSDKPRKQNQVPGGEFNPEMMRRGPGGGRGP